MQHPQIAAVDSFTRFYALSAKAALAVAPLESVAFVCDLDDELAADLLATYAPLTSRFGAAEFDRVRVFALRFDDAMRLLCAPDHRGDKATLIRIAFHLSPQHVVGIACGALVLRDMTDDLSLPN